MKQPKQWIAWVLCVILGISSFYFWKKSQPDTSTRRTTHQILLTEVEHLGKMELVRYQFRDIVEHEQVKQWLPNSRVLLIVSGEAVGCLDLSQIDSTDISADSANVTVYLPEPEICYHKIDHQKSKVYNTEYAFMEEAQLIDEAYRHAEKQILTSALQANILAQTKANAQKILVPLFASLTGKKIHLRYRNRFTLPQKH
ncbi:Protein of unknown function [Flexibacter flexilis DSM 6793]|uniref:DUF4230 domain-containing protein n=1 Tax=Flexibacter flexilis DSM 6793 TaxID=927664 RepID=A0A1I1IYG2_9BACT|nr:DUF4230 domain-containing protein [Flexibacter flexilis]SFC38260.1 Protein of unknown function [Flexibacter flexilis DSM 6793]